MLQSFSSVLYQECIWAAKPCSILELRTIKPLKSFTIVAVFCTCMYMCTRTVSWQTCGWLQKKCQSIQSIFLFSWRLVATSMSWQKRYLYIPACACMSCLCTVESGSLVSWKFVFQKHLLMFYLIFNRLHFQSLMKFRNQTKTTGSTSVVGT